MTGSVLAVSGIDTRTNSLQISEDLFSLAVCHQIVGGLARPNLGLADA